MIIPVCDKALSLSGEYDIIPIYREIYADVVTPITLLRCIAERSSRFYLLESIEGGEKWGRYSFPRHNPVMRVTCRCGKVKTESHVSRFPSREIQTAHPMDVLRETLVQHKAPRLKGQSPSAGGFVGYLVYATIEYAEPVLHINRDGANDSDLMLFGRVIAYDHLKQKTQVVANMKTGRTERVGGTERGDREEQKRCEGCKGGEDRENRNTYSGLEHLMKEYGRACEEVQEIASLINDTTLLKRLSSLEKPPSVCSVSEEELCDTVEKTKEYTLDEDIFQAVISRQFISSYEGSLLNAYRVLRTTNPSPYMVYMNIDQDEIISISPETLVRLENRYLTTPPVAGSRSRGGGDEKDRRLEEELLADEKELSEHNMLVDLGRNDIGRTAEPGPAEVTEYKMIHRYSKIMHICSQVEGNIKPGLDGCSAVELLSPVGILSGAPKIRVREIIEKLESAPRGIYSGALEYLDFTGSLDTCTAIRMAVKQTGEATVQAGGGIVMDSIPKLEYEESANKAKVVIWAILQTGEVDDG